MGDTAGATESRTMNKRTVTDLEVGTFYVSHEKDAGYEDGLRGNLEYRDLAIAKATGGKVLAQVIRTKDTEGTRGDMHKHELDFHMVYVLAGKATFYFEGVGDVDVEAGSSWYQEPGIHHRQVWYSKDFKVLEITIPADFRTTTIAE